MEIEKMWPRNSGQDNLGKKNAEVGVQGCGEKGCESLENEKSTHRHSEMEN
jgi:hypothetical protein